MIVFIVLGVFPYEGSSILAAFDSFEKAQAFQADNANLELGYPAGMNTGVFFDHMVIEEKEVK